MEQFEKEITFLTKSFDPATGLWGYQEVTKTAKFRELNRTDRTQHKLHFKLIAIFEQFGVVEEGDEGKMKIDSDGVYDLSVKAIRTLLIPDAEFTEADKTEFLNDSAAIINFGMWALSEKFTPFFSQFRMT